MLVEIDDKVVSTRIFEKKFVCDLNACKGACCVEGDAGAPLTFEEVDILEDCLDSIIPYMRPEGVEAVEKTGVFYLDTDNEPVTTLINGAECAFVYFDEQGISKCAVEKAWKEGKIDFRKPLSCHLYPIRVKDFGEVHALNYDEWSVCESACACGDKLDVPVFRFLREPLIRAFGDEFYRELEEVDEQLKQEEVK